jgi:hypothetical protein
MRKDFFVNEQNAPEIAQEWFDLAKTMPDHLKPEVEAQGWWILANFAKSGRA